MAWKRVIEEEDVIEDEKEEDEKKVVKPINPTKPVREEIEEETEKIVERKEKQPMVYEREITLGLLNEKLNYIMRKIDQISN